MENEMKSPTHIYVDRANERQGVTRRPVRRESQPTLAGATGLLGALQRSAGNQAVRSLLRRYSIQRQADEEEQVQAKREGMAIQRAGEEEEEQVQAKHADAASLQRAGEEDEEQVQAKFADAASIQRAGEEEDEQVQAKREAVAIQRAGEEDEEQVQAKRVGAASLQRAGEEEEEQVQAKAEIGLEGGPLGPELAGRIQARRGGGTPLDAGTRARMETAFGASFADVGIHTDGEADHLNRSISAVAFTTGSDIFFRQGSYEPTTATGRQLLAHELTHVVQQRGMSGTGPMTVGPADDGYERQADSMATTVSRAVENGQKADLPSPAVAQDGVQLQRLVSTSALFRAVELQRDDAAADASADYGDQSGAANVSLDEPVDSQLDLSVPEEIPVPPDQLPSQPGDYEPPSDPNVAMAKRVQRTIVLQRDDDKPHPSADAQNQSTVTLAGPTQAPWSLQVTAIYRNLNIAQIKALHLDLGHEPQVSLSVDSTGGMSTQLAFTLINWHYMPSWNREIEVGLSALANYTLYPKLSSLYGTQLQVEQHIVPWFSVTLNASGYWIPPQGGESGKFGASAGLGGLIHFDAL
jgi:hypothetical protein